MNRTSPCVLTLNGGSSSIRFAVDATGADPERWLSGKLEAIGTPRARLHAHDKEGNPLADQDLHNAAPGAAIDQLLDWLESQPIFSSVVAVGHRVVHGMEHTEPERITPLLLDELEKLVAFDPEHLPREIALIKAIQARHPELPQVACFDTAFHHRMPRVAQLLAIPRRYQAQGVRRYGFHGLSYAYLVEELGRIDPVAAKGRGIFAHLGNGSSLAAVRDCQSVDTSMGFTPASGLVMSTRSGDLDPGLLAFLVKRESMTPEAFDRMVNHESGLIGVSETSADVRDLLSREATDVRAAEALELFCYQAKKWIGAYAAVLGGLDTLVFAGGIGENAPQIRESICDGLGFLGIELNEHDNAKNAAVISHCGKRVTVRVIRTDEERMIARSVGRMLGRELRQNR